MEGAILSRLEGRRRRALLLSRLLFLLGGSLGLLVLISLGPWGLILLPFTLLLALTGRLPLMGYAKAVRAQLLPLLAKRMGLRYLEEGFSLEEVQGSGLFAHIRYYASEGGMEGEVEGFPFRMALVELGGKPKPPPGGKKAGRPETGVYHEFYFRGLLLRFRLPFSLGASVRIVPQGGGSRMGEVASSRIPLILGATLAFFTFMAILFLREGADALTVGSLLALALLLALVLLRARAQGEGKTVRLEGVGFEALFEVYARDPRPLSQVEARTLLTPAVMEGLLALRKSLRRPFWVAAEGQDLWLALPGEPFPVEPVLPLKTLFQRAQVRWRGELEEVALIPRAFRLREEVARRGLLWEGREEGRP